MTPNPWLSLHFVNYQKRVHVLAKRFKGLGGSVGQLSRSQLSRAGVTPWRLPPRKPIFSLLSLLFHARLCTRLPHPYPHTHSAGTRPARTRSTRNSRSRARCGLATPPSLRPPPSSSSFLLLLPPGPNRAAPPFSRVVHNLDQQIPPPLS